MHFLSCVLHAPMPVTTLTQIPVIKLGPNTCAPSSFPAEPTLLPLYLTEILRVDIMLFMSSG